MVLSKLTPVTAMVLALTVTVQVAVLSPSFVFAVIVAVPTAFPVIAPEEETDAICGALDVQVTSFTEAFDGVIIKVG